MTPMLTIPVKCAERMYRNGGVKYRRYSTNERLIKMDWDCFTITNNFSKWYQSQFKQPKQESMVDSFTTFYRQRYGAIPVPLEGPI